ncbi:MAG: PspA/IM30 family protein [Bryobacteraceae bacterium]
MALLDRVTRLIRANLNALVDQAENPEKLLRQLLLDMENQQMQVKTQVAIAIADWHVLEKKKAESAASHAEWIRKAEVALAKGDEKLARVALERSIPFESAVRSLSQQLDDQNQQIETLKTALRQLESKLAESRSQADVLIARYRRARTAQRAATASTLSGPSGATMSGMDSKVLQAEANAYGAQALVDLDEALRIEEMEKSDKIDRLLASLRARITE